MNDEATEAAIAQADQIARAAIEHAEDLRKAHGWDTHCYHCGRSNVTTADSDHADCFG